MVGCIVTACALFVILAVPAHLERRHRRHARWCRAVTEVMRRGGAWYEHPPF